MENVRTFQHVVESDDELKKELERTLKKCGIKIGQIEIAVSECRYHVGGKTDDPSSAKWNTNASKNFPFDEMKVVLELQRQWYEGASADSVNQGSYEEKLQKRRELPKKIRESFQNFSDKMSNYIICLPKMSENELTTGDDLLFMFLLVRLQEEDLHKYREFMECVLELLSGALERAHSLPGFLAYNLLDLMFPNKRVFEDSYVEWFLKKRELPEAEVLVELSAEKYEGSESEARIYFDLKETEVAACYTLDEPGSDSRIICSKNRRMIRKMMEISKRGKIYLLAERSSVMQDNILQNWCVTKLIETKPETDQGFYIKFFGYLCWGIVYEGQERIIYEKGRYILNDSSGEKAYMDKIEELQGEISKNKEADKLEDWFGSGRLAKLIESLRQQKHGTAVILSDADSEAERLCKQNRGMLVKEGAALWCEDGNWHTERLLSVTNIDGALFMSLDGRCRALGVIVDGTAEIPGDTGKGARYNSIVNYVRQKGKGIFLGVIISEDGMVELTCNLQA